MAMSSFRCVFASLFVVVVFLQLLQAVQTSSNDADDDDYLAISLQELTSAVDADYNDHDATRSRDYRNIPAVAPKCWKTATGALLKLTSPVSIGSNELCHAMTEHHQKLLALEIAKCHLNDMGMELFQDTQFTKRCNGQILSEGDDRLMLGCLKLLSSAGVNAYTHYVSHVQVLCARLTHEAVSAYQQESYERLVRQFHVLSRQSTTQIDTLHRSFTELSVRLDQLSNLASQLQEQIGNEFLVVWNESAHGMLQGLERSLQQRLNTQLQSGTTQLLKFHQHLEKRNLRWMSEQERLLDVQIEEINEQRRDLANQREHIGNMTASLMNTVQKLKPISPVEHLSRMFTDGYRWLATAWYILCGTSLMWLVTSFSITKRFRRHVYAVAWVETSVEVLLRVLCYPDDCPNLRNVSRALAIFLGTAIFISGTISSILGGLTSRATMNRQLDDVASDLGTGALNVDTRAQPTAHLQQNNMGSHTSKCLGIKGTNNHLYFTNGHGEWMTSCGSRTQDLNVRAMGLDMTHQGNGQGISLALSQPCIKPPNAHTSRQYTLVHPTRCSPHALPTCADLTIPTFANATKTTPLRVPPTSATAPTFVTAADENVVETREGTESPSGLELLQRVRKRKQPPHPNNEEQAARGKKHRNA